MKQHIPNRLFIHATNVHQGGGYALLLPLLKALPTDVNLLVSFDTRWQEPNVVPEKAEVRWVRPTVWHRLKAEWWLARNMGADDLVLCFGNLPPIFRLPGKTLVFLQNRYLIEPMSLAGFPLKTRIRIWLERLWLRLRADEARAFIVQTPSMKQSLISSGIAKEKPIHVLPFVSNSEGYRRSLDNVPYQESCRFDFLYVASGEPHKNHKALVEAWCLLAAEGVFPSLALTLDKKTSVDLLRWVDQQRSRFNLQMENLGCLPHEEVRNLYKQVKALIYPSSFESFGLPLIEARQSGLPVLAAELDYVRDLLDPEQSFDPQSPVSISRAVKRFMSYPETPLPLMDATGFIRSILEKSE